MGGQTWTHTMELAIPANAHAGAYTSTWTYSLVVGSVGRSAQHAKSPPLTNVHARS